MQLFHILKMLRSEHKCAYFYPQWSIVGYGTGASLKRKSLHFDEMFITGCTGSCQNDNFQCSQWWKFRQNDDIFVSVILVFVKLVYWVITEAEEQTI